MAKKSFFYVSKARHFLGEYPPALPSKINRK